MRKIIIMLIGVLFIIGGGRAAWADKPLTLESDDGKFELKFGIQLQPQYQFVSIEGHGKTNSFQIRRGRLIFSGHAFTKELTYKVQFEAVGGRTTNASPGVAYTGPNLRDAYINYDFGHGIQVKAGQFKAPYNREELTSSTKLQFVDRSVNNEAFSFGRGLGIEMHGKPVDRWLEYSVFAVNDGNNINAANRNLMFLVGGRLVFNILGEPGYTISDLDFSETPKLAVGIAGNYNRLGGTVPEATTIATTSDVILQYRGFSLYGEGNYLRNHTAKTNTFGFLGEAGYFLIPKRFEVAGRFAGVVPTGGVTKGYEAGACFNYYFFGHNLKIQADYSALINGALVKGAGGTAGVNGPANIVTTGGAPGFIQGEIDHRARVQLQLYL